MPTNRQGLTLIELLAVCAIMLILGLALGPTLSTSRRDTQVKAGADAVHEAIAKTRARAIEQGKPYRLSYSAEQNKFYLQSDIGDDTGSADDDDSGGPLEDEVKMPTGVTAALVADEDMTSGADDAGLVRIATFLPDGTCREDSVVITVNLPSVGSQSIRLRGITGISTDVKPGK